MFDNNPKDSSKKNGRNSNSYISFTDISMSEVQEYQPTKKFNLSGLWDNSQDSGSDEDHPIPLQEDSQASEPNPALMVDPFDEPFDYPESMPFSIPVNAKFIPKGLVKDGDVNTLKVMFMLANQPQENEDTSNVVADAAGLGDVPPTQVSMADVDEQSSSQEFGCDEDIRALEEMFGLENNQPQQAQAASNEVVNSINQEEAAPQPQVEQDVSFQQVLLADLRECIRQSRLAKQALKFKRAQRAQQASKAMIAQQQLIQQIEQAQSIGDLNTIWKGLATKYDIDDDMVFEFWKMYGYMTSLESKQMDSINSAIHRFFSYLRNIPNSRGIEKPTAKDVLNFIVSIRSSEDKTKHIAFRSARTILSQLKTFFEFLNNVGIYKDDITGGLDDGDLRRRYKEDNKQNNPQQTQAKPSAAATNAAADNSIHEEVIPQPQQVGTEPSAAATNVVVDNSIHEEVQPQEVIRVPQDRPRLSPQQAQLAEIRQRIRQGLYVPQVPRISRVHMAQPAPRTIGRQDFASTLQQQLIMHEQLMQQARLMQQAGQLQQPEPLTEEQKQQKIAELKKQWGGLAIHCDIDDDRVFKFWKKYANMQLWTPGTISTLKSIAKKFCAYLKNTHNSGGIQHPKTQDVFDFIGSLRLEEDSTKPIKFNYAKTILSQLKPFFEFLNDVGIYNNDIAKGLNTENLCRVYGEDNNQNNPQPDQVQEIANDAADNSIHEEVIPQPQQVGTEPSAAATNVVVDNSIHEEVQPQEVIRVPQDRPRLSSQQAQMAEVRKRIRQGQYVPKAPKVSRVHKAKPAPKAMDPQQQQLIQQIEQAQSVDDLNTIWKNLATDYDIDDGIVFKFLKKYANMKSWAPSTIPNIGSNAKRFLSYLRNNPNSGGIEKPTAQDVLDFIGSLRSNEDETKPIEFSYANSILSYLKNFCKFLKDIGIYKDDIAEDLTGENLHIIYGHQTKKAMTAQQQQKIAELKTQWKNREVRDYNIDDDIIFEFLKEYGNVFSWTKGTAQNVKSNAKSFFSYLKNTHNSGGIQNPKPQDVLNFIGSLRSSKDKTKHLEFDNAVVRCKYIKRFFKFLSDVEIYKNDINTAKCLRAGDIRNVCDQEIPPVPQEGGNN